MGQFRLRIRSSSCFIRAKCAARQLHKGFLYFLNREARDRNRANKIADEVNHMEGHFPVLTISNGEAKKFFVAVSYLVYHPFVKLLEAAEQEFGFDQPGILAIMCEAKGLQIILLTKKN